MSFVTDHGVLAAAAETFGLKLFDEDFKSKARQAIGDTGKWHRRRCPLGALLVLWTVLGLVLYRQYSIVNVLRLLMDLLREEDEELSLRAVTPEALCHARSRMSSEPLKRLYDLTTSSIDPKPFFNGLTPWNVDGVEFRIPDTRANVDEFGRHRSDRGEAGYPHMKAVLLSSAETRQTKSAVLMRCGGNERDACAEFLPGLTSKDLVIMDRGVSAGWLFGQLRQAGVHYLGRISSNWQPTVIKRLGQGDYLVDCQVSEKETIRLRMLVYDVSGHGQIRLLTDLVDRRRYPAQALAELYNKRWECELMHDEIKTHLSTVTHGAQPTTFRSKRPDGIRQEAYALLIIHNLIRGMIKEAAAKARLQPLVISFVDALTVIRLAVPRLQAARTKVQHTFLREQLLHDIAQCRLDRPRRSRRYARVVKVKMSKFGLKRSTHRQERTQLKVRLVG